MHVAAADRVADLRIGRTQFALLVMRQRLFLRSFGERVGNCVRYRTLLHEQQGEDE